MKAKQKAADGGGGGGGGGGRTTREALRHVAEMETARRQMAELRDKCRAKCQTAGKMITALRRQHANAQLERARSTVREHEELQRAILTLNQQVEVLSVRNAALDSNARLAALHTQNLVDEITRLKSENAAHYDTLLLGRSRPPPPPDNSSVAVSTKVSDSDRVKMRVETKEVDEGRVSGGSTTSTQSVKDEYCVRVGEKREEKRAPGRDAIGVQPIKDEWCVHEVVSWMYAEDDDETGWRLSADSDVLEKLYRYVCDGPNRRVDKRINRDRSVHLEMRADMADTRCYQSNVTTFAVRPLVRRVRRKHARSPTARDVIGPEYKFLTRATSAPCYSRTQTELIFDLVLRTPYARAVPTVDFSTLRILSVTPHHNPTTHVRYEQRKDDLRKGGLEVHEVLAFHGYSDAELPSILERGLLKLHASEGLLASGIYASTDVRYSFLNYTTNCSTVQGEWTGKVLLVRLLLGRVYNAAPGETLSDVKVHKLQSERRIHSVCSCTTDKGNTPIYAVYADDHADVLSVLELTLPAAAPVPVEVKDTSRIAAATAATAFQASMQTLNRSVRTFYSPGSPSTGVSLTTRPSSWGYWAPSPATSFHASSLPTTPSVVALPVTTSSAPSPTMTAFPLDEDDLQTIMNQANVGREVLFAP